MLLWQHPPVLHCPPVLTFTRFLAEISKSSPTQPMQGQVQAAPAPHTRTTSPVAFPEVPWASLTRDNCTARRASSPAVPVRTSTLVKVQQAEGASCSFTSKPRVGIAQPQLRGWLRVSGGVWLKNSSQSCEDRRGQVPALLVKLGALGRLLLWLCCALFGS